MAIVVILLLLALFLAVVKNPANAVATTVMLFAFEQFAQAHVPLFMAHSATINIIFALFVLVALVQRARRGEQIASNISHGTLLLAVMYIAHPVSALWAPAPDVTLSTFLHAFPYIVVLTFLPSLTVRGVDDLNAALKTLWLFASILLVFILLTVDFASRGLLLQRFSRARISEANPLALSSMAGSVTIIAAVVRPWKGKFGQMVCALTVVLGLYVCVRTGSRGQFVATVLALGISIGVQAWFGTIRSLRALLVAAVGVAILGWLFGLATEQFGDRFSFERMQSVYEGGRVDPSEGMLRAWAAAGPWAWVWGLGGSASFYYIGFYPHVVPVEVLTELGGLGLLLYVGFAVLAVARARWLLGVVPHDKKDVIICACALFGYEWMLALKQGALLAADFMMCHGLILCGIAQVWKLRVEADGARWAPTLVDQKPSIEAA